MTKVVCITAPIECCSGYKYSHCNSLPNDKILALNKFKTCRRQNNSNSKVEICIGKSRKHFGKKRKCWLPAFSPFPTMFSKAFFSRGVKSWDCVVMG